MPEAQSFKNHGRVVPVYHIGVFFPFVVNFFWAIYRLTRGVTGESIVSFILAIALLLMFFSVRIQILTVQDRVIRLEMQLRLRQVLPGDLHAQIPLLTLAQLVALRFASDAELPALTREVLGGKLGTQKEIKMRVKDWQADVQRA
jgi:hypothetical protein